MMKFYFDNKQKWERKKIIYEKKLRKLPQKDRNKLVLDDNFWYEWLWKKFVFLKIWADKNLQEFVENRARRRIHLWPSILHRERNLYN